LRRDGIGTWALRAPSRNRRTARRRSWTSASLRASFRALVALLGVGVLAGVGCGTVDGGDPPADVNACRPSQMFFVDQIWPNFLAKDYGGKTCGDARCHDAASSRLLRVVAPTSTATPSFPLAGGSDWEALYRSAAEQMSCTNVLGSELYVRPAGIRTHTGGSLIQPSGPEAQLLLDWVAQ